MKDQPTQFPSVREACIPWIFTFIVLGPALSVSTAALDHYTFVLWSASILLLGMPHGASDWLLFQKLNSSKSRRSNIQFLALYVLLAVGYFLLWQIVTTLAILSFLVMTAWHWGSADSTALRAHPKLWICASLSRGGLVMISPFAFYHEEALQFIQTLAGNTEVADNLISQPSLGLLVIALAVTNAATWSIAAFHQFVTKSTVWVQCLETLGLLLLFSTLPPLLSVGAYFLCIHSLRHSLRLTRILPCSTNQNTAAKLLNLHLKSFACVLPVIACLGLWAWKYPTDFSSIEQSIASYLIVVAALTLPHAILIFYLDLQKPPLNSGHTL